MFLSTDFSSTECNVAEQALSPINETTGAGGKNVELLICFCSDKNWARGGEDPEAVARHSKSQDILLKNSCQYN